MHQIKIDLSNCIGCKKCVDACFVDVIVWDEQNKRPIAKYPEECATCNWCELKCPENCIEVIPHYPFPNPEYFPKSIYPAMGK